MKKEIIIPQIEYEKSNKKEIIWSIICIIAFIVIKDTPFLRSLFSTDSITGVLLISIFFDLLLLFIAIFTFKDKLKKDLKIFKGNLKAYIKFLCPKFIMFIVIYIIVSSICTFALGNGEQSENQKLLNFMPVWWLILDAVLLVPILEEFIFRGIPRRFLKNKIIFILVSAILFGIAHITYEKNIITAIINMIPYSVMGGFFAYVYASTENLTTNMLCHIIYNAMVVLLMMV